MKVLKFGGTSMATGAAVRCVEKIVRRDERAKIIVVSAPGKRYEGDRKVTDLLLEAYEARRYKDAFDALLDRIQARFDAILRELSLPCDLTREWAELRERISEESRAYAASRGEYFSARLLAALLGATFIDAVEIIRFNEDGTLDEEETNRFIRARLTGCLGRVVIPGFYGATKEGKIVTFARGGSDITGALLAGALDAESYENRTDVDGFLAADPSVCFLPRVIGVLTYEEARALGKMGAGVLHPESIAPLQKAGVPAYIRNTFNPAAKGTLIASAERAHARKNPVAGIAGKKVSEDLARVAVVGRHIEAQRVLAALTAANIRPQSIEQEESALVASIPACDYSEAVNALYAMFL